MRTGFILGSIITAIVGAVILLIVIRLFNRAV
ncbi:GlsB/YeaQ/YmgE family stress response membrane protein [Burkholderia cenocepacia]|nr:GlsB/YeaQ/YmgE family stress response membrane protein [Burkholderia cenocepacia]MDF0506686.1 GlsB/YeaQ/YmgE family stress response membrane protein [Burkholderia cenocepacia]